jgi:outer membrane receptor for ferric coprogen and ferric-rhodotorulic acid
VSRSYNPGTDWENKDQEINTLFAEVRQRLANDWKLQVNANYSEQDALFPARTSRAGTPPRP